MAADIAELRISAVDNASATLAAIKGKADELTGSADGINKAWNGGLMDGFTKGPGMAVVGTIGAISAAAVGLGAYFVGLAKDTMTAQAGLKSLSETTGATVEWLSAIRSTAKLSGTEMEAVGGGLVKMAKNIETGSAETEKGLAAIGLSIKDLQGLKANEQFDAVARALGNYADGAGKTAAAQLILGKSGAQLLPFIKDYNDLTEFSVKVTQQQAEQADSLEKDIKRLTAAKEAWKKVVGAELVPVLDDVVKVLLRIQTETNGTLGVTKSLAADGSIKAWAQDAARAVAMLADIVASGTQLAKIIGLAFVAVGADATAMAFKIASAAAPFDQSLRIMADRAGAFATDMRAKFNAAFSAGIDPGKYQKQLDEQFANSAAQAARDMRHYAEYGDTVGKVRQQVKGLGADAKATGDDLVMVYSKLIANINERTAAEAALRDGGEKLTEGQKFALGILKELTNAKVKFTDVQKITVARALEEMLAIEKTNISHKKELEYLVAAAKLQNEADEAWFQGEEKKRSKLEDGIKSVRELIAATVEETRMLGLSNEERIIATALFKAQAAGIDTTTEAWANLAAEMRKAVYDKKAQEETLKHLEETRAESERVWKGIGEDITSWIMSGFKNTRDLIKKMFETLVLRPLIQPITEGLTGGLQTILGIGGATGSGGAGGLGILGSLFGGGAGAFGASASGAFQNVLGSLFGSGGGIMEALGSTVAGVSGGLSGIMGGSILSGLGQIAGALGPIGAVVAGIAALVSVFAKDEKGFKFDNSLRSAGNPQNIQTAALGNFAPSGDVDSKMLGAIQPFITKVQALDSYIAKNLLSDDAIATVRERIQNLQNPRWWNLDDPAAIEKASKYFLQQRYGAAFEEINTQVADTIKGFAGTADELLAYVDGFLQMRAVVLAAQKAAQDSIAGTSDALQTAIDQQTNSTLAAYRAQTKGLQALLDISPSATDALGQLVSGMAGFQSAALQMMLQIRQVKTAVGDMFGETIRSLQLSILSPEDQYKFLQSEAESLFKQALGSSDPLQIQALLSKLNSDVNQAMGLLSPDQRAALVPEQIARLNDINAQVQARLSDLNTGVASTLQASLTALAAKLDTVAQAQLDAAAKNATAADTQLAAATATRKEEITVNIVDRTVDAQTSLVGG